jgi:hypothetical protein
LYTRTDKKDRFVVDVILGASFWQFIGRYIRHHPAEYISIKFTHFNVSQYCFQGPSLPWSYCCWIYNYYLCNHRLSPHMLWVRISIVARCTTLCDKVCQWFETGRWFSLGIPVYYTNKTVRQRYKWNIVETVLFC